MTETVTQTDHERGAAPAPPPRGRHGRRTVLVASALVVVAAVAVVGALGLGGGGGQDDSSAPPRSGSTVPVTRATLTERTTVDGQLGYGTEIPLPVKSTGTVTWLPTEGRTVERGGTLLRVDDRPVVLLYGTLPMYRDLGLTTGTGQGTPGTRQDAGNEGDAQGTRDAQGRADGTSEAPAPSGSPAPADVGAGGTAGTGGARSTLRGMDVLQFESNLAALGYTGFTIDEEFTDVTARAVKRWQKSLGLPQTGTVGVGDIVYSAGKVRIGHAGVRLGSAVTEDVLTYTGTSRKVVVNASAAEDSWAVRGAAVTIGLPDGTSVKGEVASVGKKATDPEEGGGEGGSGAPTVPVTITVKDQKSVGRLESAPVTVEYVGRERADVLTVPVAALVALAEGGHGLETADGRFVAVKTGLFADGRVEVSGSAVREGMKVRIPE
ncbi:MULTISPECIES: peptidoglycan-binding protein [Streptomyces]|uniref:Peptidoglycan-binding protein n=1 Tax=Streptomyces koelreuteriae TaxID=2838015 RepID=A0ABX8FSJ6_9ACTN|nr:MULTISPECIES: peptidoglycan-binding protein [Streptomyces]QWB24155.1 peptidoglycan-binding protein [Streptomyces koelreuteriae]UUA07143.1 peptidoglycan-binding protein [Streptomyces koelreuteriae]UUA14772.1 peptidoglycan-binding protein [Streptomyces sp. CRCS-T-1]